MLFLVVLFMFLEVLKSVLRQGKWDNHLCGVLSFPPWFSCSISLRELFCSCLGGQIVVESTWDFFSTLCVHVCVCVLCLT